MPEGLYVLTYDYVEDIVEQRAPHRDAHLTLIGEWHADGKVVMGGAVGDPPFEALIVFRVGDPSEVEAFVAADPYVAAGLVTAHRIEPWTVVIGEGR